jgi:hypothetical protein
MHIRRVGNGPQNLEPDQESVPEEELDSIACINGRTHIEEEDGTHIRACGMTKAGRHMSSPYASV